ncbi:CoA transferase [Streptosporangium sp. NBC_01810]|uniref:CoA transferase n=1 Tax=Streptosporangium sp. NBC_01810 TaxID=2975951 RepID=UPI002DDB72D3|nr:CoA transferase [Streptosporangium sp. NBC_01810]WSA28171.1 CoA transferase [Streptosporangium sp. NBC_01810]
MASGPLDGVVVPEVIDEPWFKGGKSRAEHGDELDAHVGDWIAARDVAEVVSAFEKAEAAVAPIYDIRDVFADSQYQALDSITTVEDPDFGPIRMQNVLFRLSRTPGSIRWTGPALGAHNDEVYGERLGMSAGELSGLRDQGVI